MAYALLPLLILSICHFSSHGAPPQNQSASPGTTVPKPLPAAAEEFLQAHDQARAAVGVGPLKWSQMLANAAIRVVRYQRDNKDCEFADLSGSQYGTNQMLTEGQSWTPRMTVEGWVKEKAYYNYSNNSCKPDHNCGVYTQVVWKESLELGCAQATCMKQKASLTVCLYNPPGNFQGERPY